MKKNANENRLDRGTFQLDPNFLQGLKQSVRNGQALLALEYLVEYLTDLEETVTELQKVSSAAQETVKAKPSVKKAAVENTEGAEA